MKIKALFDKLGIKQSTEGVMGDVKDGKIIAYMVTPMGFMTVVPNKDGIVLGLIVFNHHVANNYHVSWYVRKPEIVMKKIQEGKNMKKKHDMVIYDEAITKMKDSLVGEASIRNSQYYIKRFKNKSLKIIEVSAYGSVKSIMRENFVRTYTNALKNDPMSINKHISNELWEQLKEEHIAKQL